jgi:hypothetical protein
VKVRVGGPVYAMSCPALCRASTSLAVPRKTWMAETSPAMTE